MRQRRYPSDTTSAEWALIERLLPTPACETSRGGRSEKHPRREIVDAIRYVVDTGCKWRALPVDYPPWRTVWGFMARWAAAGIVGQIRDQLAGRIRRDMGKGPRAVATVIDSQSVKAAETVSKATRGYDAGKKINGRKRHLVVDTRGLPLMVMVTPADLHDAAAAKEVLFRLRLMHPEITIVWADSAYAGKLVDWAKQHLNLTVKPVSRPKDASGFVVLPRRWVVERSLAWMMHARRHARDYERLIQHSRP
jgi:transposase